MVSHISLQNRRQMMESEEVALTIRYLQNPEEESLRGKEGAYFEPERNNRRNGTFYKLKKFCRVWRDRCYFALVPESEDPRWTPAYYTVKYCRPPPIAIIAMSILACVTYMIDYCRGLLPNYTDSSDSIAEIFVYDPNRKYQVWRLFTPLLVHTEFSHLFSNLVVQLIFGFQLEVAHKWWRVLLVYLLGVFTGTLASSIISVNTRLAGASAGGCSLIAFHLITIIVHRPELEASNIKLSLNAVVVICCVVLSLYNRFYLGIYTISESAHIFGAMTGLLLGMFILKNFQPTKKKSIMGWLCLAVWLIVIGVAVGWHFFLEK